MDENRPTRFSNQFLRAFFAAYFVAALALMSLTPPFQSPDAFAHFDRAFGIAQGDIRTTTSKGSPGNSFPVGVYQMEVVFSGMAAGPAAHVSAFEFSYGWSQRWDSPKYFTVYATGGNAPFLYLPQVVGITLGRLLSNRLLVGYYLAELMNLISFVALTRWAMSQLPKRLALPLAIFLLLPMVSSLAISVNPDCLLLALSTVFAASCANRLDAVTIPTRTKDLAGVDDLVRPWNIWSHPIDRVSFLSLLLMVIEKPPLVFLGLLIPLAEPSLNVRRFIIRSATTVGATLVAYGVWVKLFAGSPGAAASPAGVTPLRQVELIATHPVKDASVLIETLHVNGVLYAKEFIAGIGWLDTWFPSWFYQSVGIVFLLSVASAVSGEAFHSLRRVGALLVVLLTALGLLFTFYVVDTPYSARLVDGFQGRYLLPLLPSMVVALSVRKNVELSPGVALMRRTRHREILLMVLGALIFTVFVPTLLYRYWF